MLVACSESIASAGLLTAFPSAYVLQTLAHGPEALDAASRATVVYGVLESGVRHVVVCGHGGCGGDDGAPTPEVSQARVVARCRAMQADQQLGPVLRRAHVSMQALWLDDASGDVYQCDFEGRPARRLEDQHLAALFNRLDDLSA